MTGVDLDSHRVLTVTSRVHFVRASNAHSFLSQWIEDGPGRYRRRFMIPLNCRVGTKILGSLQGVVEDSIEVES
jgi:hypothetical protein